MWTPTVEIEGQRERTEIVRHSAYKGSSHRLNVAILVMHFLNGLAESLTYPISKEGGLLLAHGKLITTLPSRWLEEREGGR